MASIHRLESDDIAKKYSISLGVGAVDDYVHAGNHLIPPDSMRSVPGTQQVMARRNVATACYSGRPTAHPSRCSCADPCSRCPYNNPLTQSRPGGSESSTPTPR